MPGRLNASSAKGLLSSASVPSLFGAREGFGQLDEKPLEQQVAPEVVAEAKQLLRGQGYNLTESEFEVLLARVTQPGPGCAPSDAESGVPKVSGGSELIADTGTGKLVHRRA